ncbi:MAG: DUF192 domain-containing protein [Treponema sp.]|nr:DUF192 domain-containing protein [Treponema sp.]
MIFKTVFFPLIFFFYALTACNGQETFETRELTIESRGGPVKIIAEIALTDAQRSQGLMHRRELNDGHGMLFIFERDQLLSFWMKDTYIPLSIAFISSDGRILEIHDMIPLDLSPIRSGRSARYALEVPQGWFDRAGIVIGDRMNPIELR